MARERNPSDMSEYERWKEQYEDVDPLEDVEGVNKRGRKRFIVGAPTEEAAEQAGRCSAQLENGNWCIRLPVSTFVEGGSDYCYRHEHEETTNE